MCEIGREGEKKKNRKNNSEYTPDLVDIFNCILIE